MDKEKLNQTKVIKPPTREEIKGIILSLLKAIGNFAGVLFVGGIFYTFYDGITNNGECTLQPFARFVEHTVIPFITNISSNIPWSYIRLTAIIWLFLIIAEMVVGRYLDIETPKDNLRKAVYSWHMSTKRHREGYFEDAIAYITLRVLISVTIIGLMIHYTPSVIGSVIWIIIVFAPVLYLVYKDVRIYSARLQIALPKTLTYTREQIEVRERILDYLEDIEFECTNYNKQRYEKEFELISNGLANILYAINHRPFEEWSYLKDYIANRFTEEIYTIPIKNPDPEIIAYTGDFGVDRVYRLFNNRYHKNLHIWDFAVNTNRIAQERQKRTK